jgi:hypothetical protein
MDKKLKKLNHYSIEDVIELCDITIVKECAHLDEWVNTPIGELSAAHEETLRELPGEYVENAIGWNEPGRRSGRAENAFYQSNF